MRRGKTKKFLTQKTFWVPKPRIPPMSQIWQFELFPTAFYLHLKNAGISWLELHHSVMAAGETFVIEQVKQASRNHRKFPKSSGALNSLLPLSSLSPFQSSSLGKTRLLNSGLIFTQLHLPSAVKWWKSLQSVWGDVYESNNHRITGWFSLAGTQEGL